MTSSRLSSRTLPSRTKSTGNKPALLPAQIPLPPSPPSSDALVLESPPSQQASRRVSPRTKSSVSRQQSTRRRDTHRALEAAIESKQALSRTRPKKRRVLEAQLASSSPLTSPTNRKSARTTKRLKPSALSPAPRSPSSSPTRPAKESPSNPFVVHPGEKPRRAGAKRDEEHRKLVYVFRGKRIPYDTTEDLDHSGGSPFGTSGPKLLFPSPPSPAPIRKLKFVDEDEEISGGTSTGPMMSPSRANQRDRSQLGFQTPKRNKGKNQSDGPQMLPTPQSRPRRTTQPKPHSKLADRAALAGPVKSGKTMAKAMR
ncbi:hypothetical protein MJO29_002605 [Puccinia striiformis f. sp. tritici]|uniref:hypothetical protein n=1 Tax=Puccinia striiformis f. sp. tritici TaxID=168172 RepID=UPI002007D54A|nr:hypothetical protein Pst134EA_005505 [Puccinia striiformis f. sp. tritici]KAH9471616.1 hypothetical protein Pst134EA_005505 [Puccinia striiformis f. sp. tritici]KAI7964507.1 hypothetical protein MJO29_002605 [Puccinia striiformis f. sp. tritici]KAI9628611.1 hypothetical protein KEM48_011567 [Puccinia striiformis f. sp. tritici PST-130]